MPAHLVPASPMAGLPSFLNHVIDLRGEKPALPHHYTIEFFHLLFGVSAKDLELSQFNWKNCWINISGCGLAEKPRQLGVFPHIHNVRGSAMWDLTSTENGAIAHLESRFQVKSQSLLGRNYPTCHSSWLLDFKPIQCFIWWHLWILLYNTIFINGSLWPFGTVLLENSPITGGWCE